MTQQDAGRRIRCAFRAPCELLAVAALAIIGGLLALPYAGWGAVYVVTGGLWLLGAAALTALILLGSVVVFRARYRRWYFGIGTSPERPT